MGDDRDVKVYPHLRPLPTGVLRGRPPERSQWNFVERGFIIPHKPTVRAAFREKLTCRCFAAMERRAIIETKGARAEWQVRAYTAKWISSHLT